MAVLPRKVIVPAVLGVWAAVLLVGVHTLAVLPWFTDYYDFYGAQPGFDHATIATAFRHGYPLGAVLALATVIVGARLMRRRASTATELVWYAAASLVLVGAWFVWTLLAERSIYVLSFPA